MGKSKFQRANSNRLAGLRAGKAKKPKTTGMAIRAAMVDHSLKKQYNHRESFHENMKKMDITPLVESALSAKALKAALPQRGAKLPEHEVPILRNLVQKYGEDVQKMFMDTKLNPWQWTPQSLQKKLDLFHQEAFRSIAGENQYAQQLDRYKPMSVEGKAKNVFGH